jgi:hypothetical protein
MAEGTNLMRDKKPRKLLKALIPQPLLPSLGEGELEPQAESLAPSLPSLGEGFQYVPAYNGTLLLLTATGLSSYIDSIR